jgi:hypothetical protein
MESIIAKYETARGTETITERVTLLETQLVEVQQLYANYMIAKSDATAEAMR